MITRQEALADIEAQIKKLEDEKYNIYCAWLEQKTGFKVGDKVRVSDDKGNSAVGTLEVIRIGNWWLNEHYIDLCVYKSYDCSSYKSLEATDKIELI